MFTLGGRGIRASIMARRFFSYSVQELEALFTEKKDDADTLLAILDELDHRKRERAGRLRAQVTERLANLQSGASAQKPVSENCES